MKVFTTSLAIGVLCTAIAVEARPGHHHAPAISMAQAQTIALRAAPGRVAKAEYEHEDGGWRYSFDILQGKRIHEIGVDAATERIVENGFEAPGAKD